MQYKEYEIKKGIKVHTIKTEKFKTNIVSAFITTELNKENVTKNAVISSILRRGSMELKTQEEINKKMEEMYGASFDCGLDKTGDNQIIKFYIETVNDKYLPEKSENIFAEFERTAQTKNEKIPYGLRLDGSVNRVWAEIKELALSLENSGEKFTLYFKMNCNSPTAE